MAKKELIQNREKIDDFFRDALKDHQIKPSRKVWNGISKRYWGGFSRRTILVLSFLFIGVGGTIIYFSVKENAPEPSQIVDNTQKNSDVESSVLPEAPETGKSDQPIVSTEYEQTEDVEENEQPAEVIIEQAATQNETEFDKPATLQTETDPDYESTAVSEIEIPAESNYFLFKMKMLSLSLTGDLAYPDFLESRPRLPFRSSASVDYARKKNIYVGAHAGAGITYYETGPQKNFFSFDLTSDFRISKNLTFEAGTGVFYEQDNGEYKIDYESWDSVGYYNNVVSFTVDPLNPDSIIFITKAVGVFDSIQHYSVSKTVNSYLYVQFPFALRYKFLEYKRFSFAARAGASFMLMLNRDEPEAKHNLYDVEILEIASENPERLNTAWRFNFGLNIRYQLSNKLLLTVEPNYQRYVSTLYRKRHGLNALHPYSFGFRTGLTIEF